MPDALVQGMKVGSPAEHAQVVGGQRDHSLLLDDGFVSLESEGGQMLAAIAVASVESRPLTPADNGSGAVNLIIPASLAAVKAHAHEGEFGVSAVPDRVLGDVHGVAVHHRTVPPRSHSLALAVVTAQPLLRVVAAVGLVEIANPDSAGRVGLQMGQVIAHPEAQ